MPHREPQDRIDTAMSDVFFVGVGDQFDDDRRRIRSVDSSFCPETRPTFIGQSPVSASVRSTITSLLM
jgi:hypothetical protein